MSLSLTEIIALRRLAGVYRRILVLAVPVALAGCQDGGDALAPDATDAGAEVSAPVEAATAATCSARPTSTGSPSARMSHRAAPTSGP